MYIYIIVFCTDQVKYAAAAVYESYRSGPGMNHSVELSWYYCTIIPDLLSQCCVTRLYQLSLLDHQALMA